MNQIQKKSEIEVGISVEKFYTWNGNIPSEMLKFIDTINLALDLPTLEESQVLLLGKFIIYEFSTLTMLEIEDAIFKAKSGKLECNSSDYNKLSIDFLGRILNAYVEYKKKKNLIIKIKDEKEIIKIEYTKDEEFESYNFLKKIYESGEKPHIANWNLAFKYMEENNIINYTNDEKEIFKQNVIEDIKEEIKKLRIKKKNYEQLADTLNNIKYIQFECRKRIIKLYFENEM